ncbi:5-formyltetrahydrofolate cyclo-ligase [Pedobacter sp. ASV1-7]|uniref:5-formyltetrahydrofolate cyclo-ligase n=1 Tax=Pedobacter sp. ASV1-7 TaxID=3145237 RepID=UPI0032E8C9B3
MTKAEIRKIAGLRRKTLFEEDVDAYSKRLLDLFSSLDLSSIKVIHVFLPIADKNEPNTFLIIDWLTIYHPEIRIIVPKADFNSSLMINYVYKGRKGLVKSLYGILEPEMGELHSGGVDMVLIPMLAFDLQGYRVGYGKGFYDRFLQDIDVFKIGLSFFDPVDRIDDINEHDVRMDSCITPDRIYRF